MRPIDLAREHGLSAQAIRNYDDAGALPPTERSASGYRRYTPLHAQALRTFLALRAGHGHSRALDIMRAINRGDTDSAYRLIDATHAELRAERDTRTEVAAALGSLATSPTTPVRGHPLTVGELARRLAVHPATLRAWESANILHPQRDRATGYRTYGPDSVRDAEIARQLRRGGYPLPKVAQFLESLREAGGSDALSAFLEAWQDRLTTRSRALLTGAAQLDTYLTQLDRTCDHDRMTRPAESIHRDNVHLRRIRPTDADTLHRIINESLTHLRPWMNWVPQTGPHPRAAVDEFLTRTRENWSAGTSYTYLVTVSGQPVGVCGLEQRIGPDGLEIGYWLHPDHTGHGYITTAAAALTDQAFTLPGITRVQIWTDEANTASARVPQRLGFTEIARRTPARDPLTPAESGTDVIWELTRST